MGKKIDLSGKKFNRLTAIRDVGSNASNSRIWECRCECGEITTASASELRNGHKQSCGCLRKERAYETNVKDLAGKKFNRLTVIKDSGERYKGSNGVLWLCECDCGNLTKVPGNALKKGVVKSCGCYQSEDLIGMRFGRLVVTECDSEKYTGTNRHKLWNCRCDCGNVVRVSTGNLKSGHTKSCGCLALELRTGKNNNRYNPNLTEEDRLKNNRYTITGGKMSRFRKSVFERDNYTCKICGVRSGNGKKILINAHHLDGWNWCKEKRFDTDNGITLCSECHKKFHREYGSGDNTKEQFEFFLKKVLV